MEIIINGKIAYLKKNTSFEYIAENPLFTGSDSYTLTITFPLKGCPQNIDIFGHLYRQDVLKNKVVFDCEIRDKQFYKLAASPSHRSRRWKLRHSSWRDEANRTSTILLTIST